MKQRLTLFARKEWAMLLPLLPPSNLEVVEGHARKTIHREKTRLCRVVSRASVARGPRGGPGHEGYRDGVPARIPPGVTYMEGWPMHGSIRGSWTVSPRAWARTVRDINI